MTLRKAGVTGMPIRGVWLTPNAIHAMWHGRP